MDAAIQNLNCCIHPFNIQGSQPAIVYFNKTAAVFATFRLPRSRQLGHLPAS
jgi:hypothetical protein